MDDLKLNFGDNQNYQNDICIDEDDGMIIESAGDPMEEVYNNQND